MNNEAEKPIQGAADWLDELLLGARSAPVADEGFTARVMQQLPPRLTPAQLQEAVARSGRQSRRFELFTWVGAVVGSAVAFGAGNWLNADELNTAIAAMLELRPVSSQFLAPWLATIGSAALLAWVLQKS